MTDKIAIIGPESSGKAVLTSLQVAINELSEKDLILYEREMKIFKTDGDCKLILVDNPDRHHEGRVVKRRRQTNFTPKKKKRKK